MPSLEPSIEIGRKGGRSGTLATEAAIPALLAASETEVDVSLDGARSFSRVRESNVREGDVGSSAA